MYFSMSHKKVRFILLTGFKTFYFFFNRNSLFLIIKLLQANYNNQGYKKDTKKRGQVT